MSAARLSRQLTNSAAIFAALGDRTRLRLVARLTAGGPASITRLAAGARVTRQAITKHLHVLEGAGLARARRRGREQLWEFDAKPLPGVQASLELISRQWEQALGRLKVFVEEQGQGTVRAGPGSGARPSWRGRGAGGPMSCRITR